MWRSASERTSESRREEKEGVRRADRACVQDYSHTKLGGVGGIRGSFDYRLFLLFQAGFSNVVCRFVTFVVVCAISAESFPRQEYSVSRFPVMNFPLSSAILPPTRSFHSSIPLILVSTGHVARR